MITVFENPNCPFYGCSYVFERPLADPPLFLLPLETNQCALVVTSYATCFMEIAGQRPEWTECRLVHHMRGEA